jgi:hypothetical protein
VSKLRSIAGITAFNGVLMYRVPGILKLVRYIQNIKCRSYLELQVLTVSLLQEGLPVDVVLPHSSGLCIKHSFILNSERISNVILL